MINLFKPKEIQTEFNSVIEGPALLFIDYNSLNDINSISIESNKKFYINEQYSLDNDLIGEKDSKIIITNLYITKYNNLEPHNYKRAFIYFNSKGNAWLKVKKLDYSIFEGYSVKDYYPETEYFQLCQGENSPKELYFYTKKNYDNGPIEFFSSVFGNYNNFFINENTIKNISDLNFDKIEGNNFYNLEMYSGYLKINCTNPVMLSHYNRGDLDIYNEYVLTSGEKYYICDYYIRKSQSYIFDNKLKNKNIELKITLFGLRPNENVKLIFNNGKSYDLYNTSLELNYTYQNDSENEFHFKIENVEKGHLLLAEIKLAFLPEENYDNIQIKDFEDSFGTNIIEKGIIKIPKKFDESLYDYSILMNDFLLNGIDIQILYDELKFIVPEKSINRYSSLSPIIPLFKVNPYEQIYEKNENKYFYILIYRKYAKFYFTLKKPKIFTDNLNLNAINYLPKVKDKKYYYKIKLPKRENPILIETIYLWSYDIKMTLSQDNFQYPLNQGFINYNLYQFNIENNNNKKDLYLNYYDTDSDIGYINFAENIPYIYPYDSLKKKLKPEVKQIEGKNKIKINMTSSSYLLKPIVVKYYIIINVFYQEFDKEDYDTFYSIITNKTKINKSKNQFLKIIEDNGTNEIFESEIDINVELNEYNNYIHIIPLRKENNLIELSLHSFGEFNYINHKNESRKSKTLIIVLSIIGAILIILFALIICKACKKKKSSIEDDMEGPILKNDVELK